MALSPRSARAGTAPDAIAGERQAALQGDAAAQFRLGTLYDLGRGVPQDFATAALWYRRAAQQGLREAEFNLAAMYDNGRGVARDHKAAAYWYRKAARQGDGRAAYALGLMYEAGDGVAADSATAAHWFRIAADHGITAARTKLALAGPASPKGEAQALALYRRGFAFLTGQGEPKNSAAAVRWFTQAARQGSDLARYALGYLYESGIGVKADPATAFAWYRLAAATFPPGVPRDQAKSDARRIGATLTPRETQRSDAEIRVLRRETKAVVPEPEEVGEGSERR